MRTTLNIDSPLLEDLRRLQKEERKPLGRLASELIAEALANRRRRKRDGPTSFQWTSQPMKARVDLADKDAVYALLEEDQS